MSEVREQTLYGKGTPNYPVGTNKKVLVAIEDTGNAFNFYRNYLISNFSISNTDVVGVGGADSFQRELKTRMNYDAYIIIYDAGAEFGKINKIGESIEELIENNTEAKVYIFTPVCFEEVLLSFSGIQEYVKINNKTNSYTQFKKLQQKMHGMISKVNYFVGDNKLKSTEQKVEAILEELTQGTVLRYEHYNKHIKRSIMSDCWLHNCCNVDVTIERNTHLQNLKSTCTHMSLNGEKNKLALIAKNSLLGGLTNIVVDIFGIKGTPRMLTDMTSYKDIVRRVN